MEIRIARTADAAAIQQIYAPYVAHTAITFEYDVPTVEEMRERIGHTLLKYPYLVAQEQDVITGYAYAGPLRTRAAYSHCAEVSIYLAESRKREGTGQRLYQELERILLRQNVYVLNACITMTERPQDEYLPDASIPFHRHMGYSRIGTHRLCGYKFGRWYSMIWMEKEIAPRPEQPEAFIPFPELTLV